jgi:hypothetical protein
MREAVSTESEDEESTGSDNKKTIVKKKIVVKKKAIQSKKRRGKKTRGKKNKQNEDVENEDVENEDQVSFWSEYRKNALDNASEYITWEKYDSLIRLLRTALSDMYGIEYNDSPMYKFPFNGKIRTILADQVDLKTSGRGDEISPLRQLRWICTALDVSPADKPDVSNEIQALWDGTKIMVSANHNSRLTSLDSSEHAIKQIKKILKCYKSKAWDAKLPRRKRHGIGLAYCFYNGKSILNETTLNSLTVVESTEESGHAEVHLLGQWKKDNPKKELDETISVAGQKRPCMVCWSRMKSTYPKVNFNNNHGLLWPAQNAVKGITLDEFTMLIDELGMSSLANSGKLAESTKVEDNQVIKREILQNNLDQNKFTLNADNTYANDSESDSDDNPMSD